MTYLALRSPLLLSEACVCVCVCVCTRVLWWHVSGRETRPQPRSSTSMPPLPFVSFFLQRPHLFSLISFCPPPPRPPYSSSPFSPLKAPESAEIRGREKEINGILFLTEGPFHALLLCPTSSVPGSPLLRCQCSYSSDGPVIPAHLRLNVECLMAQPLQMHPELRRISQKFHFFQFAFTHTCMCANC